MTEDEEYHHEKAYHIENTNLRFCPNCGKYLIEHVRYQRTFIQLGEHSGNQVSAMEGDKRFRAEIDKLVKQRTKLRLGDRIRVKGKRLHGLLGTIDSIGSITDIKDTNSTKVQYLVRIDVTNLIYGFDFEELQQFVTPEKVSFS